MKFYTADLCDKYPENIQVLDPILKSYGGAKRVMGQIITVKLSGHNKTLVELLKSEGNGQIAVVDVDAKYTAVVGDNLMFVTQKIPKRSMWDFLLLEPAQKRQWKPVRDLYM